MPGRRPKLRQIPSQPPLPFEECQLVSAAEPVGSETDPSSALSSEKQDKETSDPAGRILMPSSIESDQDAAAEPQLDLAAWRRLLLVLRRLGDATKGEPSNDE
jgi:hypothetical protein